MEKAVKVLRIIAPHFCVGLILELGYVVMAPPIVLYTRGWHEEKVRDYAKFKKWEVEEG